jgi:hypothetical protein
VNETNDDPKPFVWTADQNRIIAAVKRRHQALDSIHKVLCLCPVRQDDPAKVICAGDQEGFFHGS